MSLTVMNFNRIRDLVSNLGYMKEDNSYALSQNCLSSLEKLEVELLQEDALNRNVRISLHICGTVREDFIPILVYGRDFKVMATVTRLLTNLTMPSECLLPMEDAFLSPKHKNIRKQLLLSSLALKKTFLNPNATLSIITMLRDAMIKSVKHNVPLNKEECGHLSNCLILIRNLLHLPENFENVDINCVPKYTEWQSIQHKFIWNLFIQGFDGALILMLNSKYRDHWTVSLALIIALLFQNQNINKIHHALECISSSSESSGEDEESDTSKTSSVSLSSEPSKASEIISNSGCPRTSGSSVTCIKTKEEAECSNDICCPLEINKKLQKVQICEDSECNTKVTETSSTQCNKKNINIISSNNIHACIECNSESSSSSCHSPYHKKIKGSFSPDESIMLEENYRKFGCIENEGMDFSSGKSSDEDNFNEKRVVENLKAVQKLKNANIQSKFSESDSSNEDFQALKSKQRSHPPTGKRGKSPHQKNGCAPSVCIESAYSASCSKGRISYPLWEKRNSVSALLYINSPAPSEDNIGILLKKFTLSFLHSGFSDLIVKIKNLLICGPFVGIDRRLFFWMLSYFLHLARTVNLSLNHINDILSADFLSFLVFECVSTCENLDVYSNSKPLLKNYMAVQLKLQVTAIKEVMSSIDLYFRKLRSVKDKSLFNELYGKLSESSDFRQVPLLLFHTCYTHSFEYLYEHIAVLNHYVLIAIERGSGYCWEGKKISMVSHMKQFATKSIVDCYTKILENFKFNCSFVNECAFTLLHHLAGDIHSSNLLLEPLLLKIFSEILKEDIELDQYQEDLIMYILNKFRQRVQKKYLKEKQNEIDAANFISDDLSSNSSADIHCLLSEEDDLFWWYLQFEQDDDPISKMAEHVHNSKCDILDKLKLKGFISAEKLVTLEKEVITTQGTTSDIIANKELAPIPNHDDDITVLLRALVQAGERHHLIWLQEILLEVCYIKLGLDKHSPEPVPFYSLKMMLPIPLVPYTNEQRKILRHKTFLSLLRKLEFQLGFCETQMYPRIPAFWTVDVIFTAAAKLGPIRKDKLKFSADELLLSVPNQDAMTIRHIECPNLPPLSSCATLSSWLTAVQQSKRTTQRSQ